MNKATSDKYGGLNSSAYPTFVATRAGGASAVRSGRAGALPAEASNIRRILTASSVLPCRASQSGLSGTNSRRIQITMLPAAPINTTQRQPSIPYGDSGTSHHDKNATTGTAVNITA